MVKKFVFVLLVLFLFNKRAVCQNKDSILLYNGQILIGTVQNADLASITIDDMDLKVQSVKFFRIKRIVITETFKIETVDKRILYGTLKTGDRPGWVDILTVEGNIVSIHITRIYQLISIEKGFFKRLNGNVSAGFSFTKSSGIGQLNLSSTIRYSTKLFDYLLQTSAISSLDSGKLSRDNENLQLLVTYDLTSSWILSTSAQYQRNLELSLARRFLGLLGGGNKLFIRKNWRLLAITGMTFSAERSTEGVSSNLLYEIPLIFQFNYYQFRHPDVQISSSQSVYFSLSEPGRIRYDGNTSISWQIIRYFYLNINPYTNFDNKPPVGSKSTFDFGLVVGLSYKF